MNDNLLLRPHQLLFHAPRSTPVEEGFSSSVYVAHRRAGKSLGGTSKIIAVIDKLLKETSIYKINKDVDSYCPSVGYVAPTKQAAREIVWKYFTRYLKYPNIKFSNQTLQVTIPRPLTGDYITVSLLASKLHDRIRGQKFTYIVFDEADDAPEDAWEFSIKPALTDTRGEALLTGTPKGKSFLYSQIVQQIELKNPNVYHLPVTQTGVFNAKEIQKLYNDSVSKAAFYQEYMCDFNVINEGTFWYDTINECEKSLAFTNGEKQDGLSIVLSVDLGIGAGFTAWASQISDQSITLLDYYEGYEDLNSLYKDLYDDDLIPDIVYLPHDSTKKQMQQYKSITMKEIFQDTFRKAKIYRVKRTPNKMVSIENTGANIPRMQFKTIGMTDTFRGLRKLKNFARKKDKSTGLFLDTILKDGNDHAADALITLIDGLNLTRNTALRPLTYKSDGVHIDRSTSFFKPTGSILRA